MGFVTGHDFSRAENVKEKDWALARRKNPVVHTRGRTIMDGQSLSIVLADQSCVKANR
jgi:hypothetical protein